MQIQEKKCRKFVFPGLQKKYSPGKESFPETEEGDFSSHSTENLKELEQDMKPDNIKEKVTKKLIFGNPQIERRKMEKANYSDTNNSNDEDSDDIFLKCSKSYVAKKKFKMRLEEKIKSKEQTEKFRKIENQSPSLLNNNAVAEKEKFSNPIPQETQLEKKRRLNRERKAKQRERRRNEKKGIIIQTKPMIQIKLSNEERKERKRIQKKKYRERLKAENPEKYEEMKKYAREKKRKQREKMKIRTHLWDDLITCKREQDNDYWDWLLDKKSKEKAEQFNEIRVELNENNYDSTQLSIPDQDRGKDKEQEQEKEPKPEEQDEDRDKEKKQEQEPELESEPEPEPEPEQEPEPEEQEQPFIDLLRMNTPLVVNSFFQPLY